MLMTETGGSTDGSIPAGCYLLATRFIDVTQTVSVAVYKSTSVRLESLALLCSEHSLSLSSLKVVESYERNV